MKNFFIAFSLFLSIYTGFSQVDFYKGYIITNKGDSLYGEILSTGYIKHSKQCTFRKDAEHELIQYLPGEISGYILENGQYYISKMHSVNNEEKLIFLEYLVNGQIDLFYYMDDQMKDHFIIQTESDEMIELDNSKKKVNIEGEDYFLKTPPFLGQLKYIYKDAPNTKKKVIQTSYTKKSLINTAVSYHNEVCQSEKCIVYKREPVELNIQIGPVFSLNKTPSVYYSGIRSDPITNSWGGFVRISTPETFKRFAFRYTMMLQEENYYTNQVEFTNEGILGSSHYTVYSSGKSKYIENLYQIEFALLNYGPLKIILQSGGYFNVWRHGDLLTYTTIYDTHLDETREDIENTEIKRNGIGIVYGAKINFELFRKSSLFIGVDFFTNQTLKIGWDEFHRNRIKLAIGINILNL